MNWTEWIIQLLKPFLNEFSGINFSSHHELYFMSSIAWKQLPRIGKLSFRKRKESVEAITGEYGHCSMMIVEFLVKIYSHWFTFSWCKNQNCFFPQIYPFSRNFLSNAVSPITLFIYRLIFWIFWLTMLLSELFVWSILSMFLTECIIGKVKLEIITKNTEHLHLHLSLILKH